MCIADQVRNYISILCTLYCILYLTQNFNGYKLSAKASYQHGADADIHGLNVETDEIQPFEVLNHSLGQSFTELFVTEKCNLVIDSHFFLLLNSNQCFRIIAKISNLPWERTKSTFIFNSFRCVGSCVLDFFNFFSRSNALFPFFICKLDEKF